MAHWRRIQNAFARRNVDRNVGSGVGRFGIGYVLAVLLSMFFAVVAQAQTDSGSVTASTVPT